MLDYSKNQKIFDLAARKIIKKLDKKIEKLEDTLEPLVNERRILWHQIHCAHNIDHGNCTRCGWNVKKYQK